VPFAATGIELDADELARLRNADWSLSDEELTARVSKYEDELAALRNVDWSANDEELSMRGSKAGIECWRWAWARIN